MAWQTVTKPYSIQPFFKADWKIFQLVTNIEQMCTTHKEVCFVVVVERDLPDMGNAIRLNRKKY